MSGSSAKRLALVGVLTAMEIVLSRFLSINAWNLKIGFGYVPLVAAAILLGPLYAGIVGALSDFLGAILFPIGPYFPGFTLTQFLMGLAYGLFLYRKESFPRTVGAVVLCQFVLGLFLNTLWISVLYGSPYVPLLSTRVVQSAVLTAVELLTIPLIIRGLSRLEKRREI